MKEVIIKVNGMVCEGCENRVKNALKELDGVKKVDASFKTGIVKVKVSDNVKDEKLEDTITDIGFDIIKEK